MFFFLFLAAQNEVDGLGLWVCSQRTQYKRLMSGKSSTMTSKRKQELDQLGFQWSLRTRVAWDKRFQELKDFMLKYGCIDDVNPKQHKQLWHWIQNQRTAYKKFNLGVKSSLTRERIQALEAIGFKWSQKALAQGQWLQSPIQVHGIEFSGSV